MANTSVDSDEISPLGQTEVIEIRDGTLSRWQVDPAIAGEANIQAADLAGGDPAHNAAVITKVLGGGGTSAAKAAVILNAAGALLVSGQTENFETAVQRAREGLAHGAGMAALERLRIASHATTKPG